MPPSKGIVWQQYLENKNEDGNLVSISCKHCKNVTYTAPNPTRMRQHLLKCNRCPTGVRNALLGPLNEGFFLDQLVDDPGQGPSSQPKPPDDSGPPAKMRRGAMTSFLDTMTAADKNTVDALFARAALVKGYPLSIFEGPAMETAFQTLRPSYKPPSGKRLGGALLDKEYSEVMKSVDLKIKEADCLTVMCDGWTNRKKDGLVNFVIGTPEPVFLKSVEPGKERENALFISSQLEAVIEKVGPAKVFFLSRDNAAAMCAACAIVQRKFPHIFSVGCACHCVDLMFKDFLKLNVLKELFRKAKVIIGVKKLRRAYATFKEKQKLKYGNEAKQLILPGKTRFHGAYLTFLSLQHNKSALQETVLIEDLGMSEKLIDIVLDNKNFWPHVNFAVQFLKPLAEGTTLLEADDAKLSHVVSIFMNLKCSVTASLEGEECTFTACDSLKCKDIVKRRVAFSVKPVHLAAYLVDPNSCGRGLSDREIISATEVITKISKYFKLDESKVVKNLFDFRAKATFFSNETLWKFQTVDALTWWKGFCQQQPLYPIVVNLLSGVPTVIACERIWSGYEHIDSKKRNRLSNSKTEKLVAVKCNYAIMHNKPEPTKQENRLKIMKTYLCTSLLDENEHNDDGSFEDDLNETDTDFDTCSDSSSCESESD